VRAGARSSDDDLATLNSFLAAGPLVCHVERDRDAYRLELVPTECSLNIVLSEIARSFAEVLVEGDARRIKICENPDCKWIFYDQSRNRTRRWCEGATGCGNLLKVRRCRARKRKGGSVI
jgi:predicted RNA-binding Zn ribbon-like protein